MGLCMGFSLVSAAEILYYLARSLFSLCSCRSDKSQQKKWAELRTNGQG